MPSKRKSDDPNNELDDMEEDDLQAEDEPKSKKSKTTSKRAAATKKRGKESESEDEYTSETEETSGNAKVRKARPPQRTAAKNRKRYVEKESDEEEEVEEEEEEPEEEEEESIEDTKFGGKWEVKDSMHFYTSDQIKPSKRVIGFDLDDTLITPKGKNKFAKDRNDWKWLLPEIPDKLRELNKEGIKIVVFTNQAGVEKNHQRAADIKGKILDLQAELGFPFQALIATATDIYRKPNTTMWDFFVKNLNGGEHPDMEHSLYVGDAGGRPKEWKAGKKKDFSCSDRAFASNIGLSFKTPEEYFLNESAAVFEWDSIDPKDFLAKLDKDLKHYTGDAPLHSKEQELIIFVGPPASGKSTFAKKYLIPHGYVHINQDTLKSKDKCVKACKEAIEAGKSVVIDNTNPSPDVRKAYVDIAKKKNVPVRCYSFQTDAKLAHHLNFVRERIAGTRRVPDVGFNRFKNQYKEPTDKEGFAEVKNINWLPDFESDDHKRLFLQRS